MKEEDLGVKEANERRHEAQKGVAHVMHLKCIHELCTIILIFQSYLHHIRVISLFYIDFRDNSQFPHLFGINPTLAENPIFYILMFQGPKRRPNDLEIYEHQFLEGTKCRSEGSEKVKARRPKEVGPCGQIPWPRGTPHLGPRGSDAVRFCLRGFVLT